MSTNATEIATLDAAEREVSSSSCELRKLSDQFRELPNLIAAAQSRFYLALRTRADLLERQRHEEQSQ